MAILNVLLLVLFVLSAILLVGMVLIQDEQGDGLAGMFGGGSQSTFGSRAGNVLTRTTSILGGMFIVLALALAFLFRTADTGDVAAAARQQGGTTEWWNSQPAQTQTAAPAADTTAADAAAPAAGTETAPAATTGTGDAVKP